MLYTGYMHQGPAAVRYPRGTGPGTTIEHAMTALPIGKGRLSRQGQQVAILNFGALLPTALSVAEGIDASVADMRFIKPLDTALLEQLAAEHTLIVTLEENAIAGGAGAGVSEYFAQQGIVVAVLHLGLPDLFIDHATHGAQISTAGLDAASIRTTIQARLTKIKAGN